MEKLTRVEASRYILDRHGISRTPNTLATLASRGGGPRFSKINNRPYYTREDIDRWVRSICSATVNKNDELR